MILTAATPAKNMMNWPICTGQEVILLAHQVFPILGGFLLYNAPNNICYFINNPFTYPVDKRLHYLNWKILVIPLIYFDIQKRTVIRFVVKVPKVLIQIWT